MPYDLIKDSKNINARTKKKISGPTVVLVYRCMNNQAPPYIHCTIFKSIARYTESVYNKPQTNWHASASAS